MKRRLLMLGGAAALAACATPQPAGYVGQKPELDLKRYFGGELTAHGLVLDRSGTVTRRFVATIRGRFEGNAGELDEQFAWTDGRSERRVWRLTDLGGGRWRGQADDVVGEATGVVSGNALNWRYTMRVPVGERSIELQFDDWMFLVDERTMLNRAVMSKFGIRLGEVLISFTRQ